MLHACIRIFLHERGPVQRRISPPQSGRASTYHVAKDTALQSALRRGRVPVMSAANGDDASNPRAKVSELSEKVVDTNPYSRLMCAGRHRHACCAVD